MYSPVVIRAADAFAKGGMVDAARSVASAGREGDSVLLHINPEEMELLRSMWGEPTVNPDTGMPEYFKMRDIIKKVLPFVSAALPVVLPGVGNAIGTALGAGSSFAGPLGNAIIGAGTGALTGGGKGALQGGLTAGALSAATSFMTDRASSPVEASPKEAPGAEKPSWLRRNALPVGLGVLGAAALGGGSRDVQTAPVAPALPASFTDPLPVLESDRELESDEDYDSIDWTTYGQRAPRSFFRNNYLPRDDDAPSTGFEDGGYVSLESITDAGYDPSSVDASSGVEGGLAGTGFDAGPTADSPSIAPEAVNFSVPAGMSVPSTQQAAPGRGGVLGYVQGAVKDAVKDAVNNPVRSGIDILTGMSPLAIPNALAKGFTGHSMGSLVTSVGRGIGDALGLNDDPDTVAAEMGYTGPPGWAQAMPTNFGYAPTTEVAYADGVSNDSRDPEKSGEFVPGTGSGSMQPVSSSAPSPLSYIARTANFEDPESYYTYGSRPQKSFYAEGGAAQGSGPLSRDPRYFEQGSGSGRIDNIPAVLSPKEYVMDAETVALLGDGNPDEGAKRLDDMRSKLRKHKGKALARGGFSPDAKSPLSYIGRS
jgi:hypothetical protein